MKLWQIVIALVLLSMPLPADAWRHGVSINVPSANSQLSIECPGSGEYCLVNLFKNASKWTYGNNTSDVLPTELDGNGYPVFCTSSCWATNSGAKTLFSSPSQVERPGHYVLAWTGGRKFSVSVAPQVGGGVLSTVSCTGSATGTSSPSCDNTACSSFTGYTSGTTLTVTVAPTGTGCTLGAGVPISNANLKISTFGTPTILISSGSVCGGNTCYTINQSQTVGSSGSPATMFIGGRFEVSVTTDNTSTSAQWQPNEQSSNNDGQISNIAFYHVSDEAAWEASAVPCGNGQACIVGTLYKTRIQQANFAFLRDLDTLNSNVNSCTTWASRKPITHYSYAVYELRNAAAGTTTYTAGGHSYTIPIAGQYVNSGGTGASGGTVSYNAGTDTYSITLGSGNFVDKQTILMLPPSTGTTSSKVSLNGNTAVAFLTPYGGALSSTFVPTSNVVVTLVYDASLGGPLTYTNGTGQAEGLLCGNMPPEVFIELNAELKTTPFHTLPHVALDPMTDWVTQYASYQKSTYTPPLLPVFEVIDEPWNCAGGFYQSFYVAAKSQVWIAADAAWISGYFCGSAGNTYGEIGKMISTSGQDLNSVYGAGNYELLAPVQTGWSGASVANDVLQSPGYVNQSVIPVQTGYTQTAAYKFATRISINNYWNAGWYGNQLSSVKGLEAGVAFCYYNYSINAACQSSFASQAAAMTSYMNTATASLGSNVLNIPGLTFFLNQWKTWALTCSEVSRPSGCTVNSTVPLQFYEGGYSPGQASGDITQSITTATNAASAVLSIASNGCVAGQTVGLSGLAGGTWSTVNNTTYTVQGTGTDASHCAINLNSTGLGTLSGGTLTYTGSQGYVNYLRTASYTAPELTTLTTTLNNTIVANGGTSPSQYLLSGNSNFVGDPWLLWSFDIYGYFMLGKCTGCTISTTTLTLGGTVTGIFRVGDTLLGGGVTGIGTGAGSNTTITSCTPTGGNVCGTTALDTLGLSQSSTVASGTTMTGNVAPTVVGSSTTSPVQAWKAICTWNGNGGAC